MRKYIWKRIFFSILSLLVVVMTVMLLVYSLTDRKAIFQTDDVWNKKNLNDRIIYEYTQYQKYGYLVYETFTTYSKNKWVGIYGNAYDQSAGFNADKEAIQSDAADLNALRASNATVDEFCTYYEGKGYTVEWLKPDKYTTGKTAGRTKPGGTGYLIAVREKPVVSRLWEYIKKTSNYLPHIMRHHFRN